MIKAAVSVNRELIQLYWSLSKDIVERDVERKYGYTTEYILLKEENLIRAL